MFIRITTGFAHVRTRMKDICRTLSTAFPGALIRDRIEFAQYENSFSENGSRYVIEFYFDIALGEGKSLCWWIDVEYIGEIWKIEASLRRDDGAGENCVWKATYQ